jgi:predicted transcriptional regulator
MSTPKRQPLPDPDLGPLDEHGQQIWSAEEEEAIARMMRDPAFWRGIEEAEADIAAGRVFTHEEVLAECAERRRRYLAERKL